MRFYSLFFILIFTLNACAFVDANFGDVRDDVELIKYDKELFNSLEINSSFTEVVKLFNETFEQKSMGKRNEKTFSDSVLKTMYSGAKPTFNINKISIVKINKKYVESYKEHYGCSDVKICYVRILWYDGIRISQSYKFKNRNVLLQGDFEVVISPSEFSKTTISIFGYDLALKLGTKCCSRRTLQPYENLFMIKNDMIEEARILMYFMDFLNLKKINYVKRSSSISSPSWKE